MDILAIGEILIDLTLDRYRRKRDPSVCGQPRRRARQSGGVASRQAGAHRPPLSGKVGADGFGSYLTSVLKQNGVDASHVAVDPEDPTTIAVVSAGTLRRAEL